MSRLAKPRRDRRFRADSLALGAELESRQLLAAAIPVVPPLVSPAAAPSVRPPSSSVSAALEIRGAVERGTGTESESIPFAQRFAEPRRAGLEHSRERRAAMIRAAHAERRIPLPTPTPAARLARAADAVFPNDPDFPRQWGLHSPNDIDIDAPQAWALTASAAPVIVAVIDSGLDLSHPDLVGRIWVNPREIPGNGRDDDGNGYADDVHGWNFVANTNNPADDYGHGTHVAAIVGAGHDNALGVAGVAPNAVIMPLKFLDSRGNGDLSNAARAIRYAVDNGARIINASWTGGGYNAQLDEAIAYAASRGVIFVAAAGNNRRNIDVTPSYPAAYRHPNVVVVGAADAGGNRARFSNYGSRSVHVLAPGDAILSAWVGAGYRVMSGTSMAAPFVSGVLALGIGMFPHLSPAELIQRLVATARPLPAGDSGSARAGMVDADNFILNVSQTPAPTRPPIVSARPRWPRFPLWQARNLRPRFAEAADAPRHVEARVPIAAALPRLDATAIGRPPRLDADAAPKLRIG